MPGVVSVLFGEDVPHNVIWVDVPGQTVEVAALKASMEVLATDRVRFHGEPVALVIAETEEALAEACDLVGSTTRSCPRSSSPTQALAYGAPAVHPGGNLLGEWDIDRGDVDAAFAAADVVVEGTYQTQTVDHAYLEPEAGVGWLDDEGVLNLRVGHPGRRALPGRGADPRHPRGAGAGDRALRRRRVRRQGGHDGRAVPGAGRLADPAPGADAVDAPGVAAGQAEAAPDAAAVPDGRGPGR